MSVIYHIVYHSILADTVDREAEQQAYGQQDKSIHVCSTHSKTNDQAQQEDRLRPARDYADAGTQACKPEAI